MEMTLLGFGAIFLILYIIIMLRRTRDQASTVKFSHLFLIIIGALLVLLSLTVSAFASNGLGQLELIVIALGLAMGILGLWKMFSSQQFLASHGFLGLGTAIILIIATFAIPIYSQNRPEPAFASPIGLPGGAPNANAPEGFPDPAVFADLANNVSDDANSYPVQANIMLLQPTPVGTAQSIPALESPVIFFISPTPTPEIAQSCTAIVETNLNLRDLPSVAAGDVITVINEGSQIQLTATDSDDNWWYMQQDDIEGWLFGDLLTLDDTCQQLPVRNWN